MSQFFATSQEPMWHGVVEHKAQRLYDTAAEAERAARKIHARVGCALVARRDGRAGLVVGHIRQDALDRVWLDLTDYGARFA